jgi:hypothetical protein
MRARVDDQRLSRHAWLSHSCAANIIRDRIFILVNNFRLNINVLLLLFHEHPTHHPIHTHNNKNNSRTTAKKTLWDNHKYQ